MTAYTLPSWGPKGKWKGKGKYGWCRVGREHFCWTHASATSRSLLIQLESYMGSSVFILPQSQNASHAHTLHILQHLHSSGSLWGSPCTARALHATFTPGYPRRDPRPTPSKGP